MCYWSYVWSMLMFNCKRSINIWLTFLVQQGNSVILVMGKVKVGNMILILVVRPGGVGDRNISN